MPPSPAVQLASPSQRAASLVRPSAQPLRISGNVSQLGTLSFHPSITAATTMAAQTNASGQLVRIKDMNRIPPTRISTTTHKGKRAAKPPGSAARLGPRPMPGAGSASVRRLRAGGSDGAADLAEGRVGVAAERGDGGDADHDNQGQHDRVLDGRRAVFTLQKINRELCELTHVIRPFPVK